jgi:putative DNA primase/helicase
MVKSQSNRPALSRFRILGSIYDEDDEVSYYEIQYRTVAGDHKKTQMKRAIFQRPSQAVDYLINMHADLPDNRKKAVKVVERGIRERSKKNWRITGRPGWYEQSFVYLTKTFGELNGKLRHRGSASIDPALGKQEGTLQTWKKGLRKPCQYSDFLVFSISLGPAAALLYLINEDEGAIFHLHGRKKSSTDQNSDKTRSTSGKSVAARCTASTIGSCRKNDLVTFATTMTAIEDYCFAHNNLAAVFDEEGRALDVKAGPRVRVEDLPYLVPSGRGAVRSNKATADPNLKNKTWSLFAISTGENPIDDRREVRPEGAQVRMISVPVPAGGRGGIYNRIKGSRQQIVKKAVNLHRWLRTRSQRTMEWQYQRSWPNWSPTATNSHVVSDGSLMILSTTCTLAAIPGNAGLQRNSGLCLPQRF